MSARKVLIQTVGTGGPNNPVWEALAFTIGRCRPDVLVQWCSRKTLRETVPRIDELLSGKDRPGDVRREQCADEDDFNALADEYLGSLDRLLREFPVARIEMDFTSGTKPMSVAAAAAAVARRIPQLHYAVGERDDSGRARKTTQLRSLSPAALVADRTLQELGLLFNKGQFAAVSQQAGELAPRLDPGSQQNRARALHLLADAYGHWDRFDWGKAFSKLREYRKIESALLEWDTAMIGRQVSHLRTCDKKVYSAERLVDLLANTNRCIAHGRYDDAVARLYRLMEYIGQARFVRLVTPRDQNNPTKHVPLATLGQLAPVNARRLDAKSRDGKVDIGLGDTIYVLAEAGDPIGRSMKQRYDPEGDGAGNARGPLANLLQSRNNSLLAHGTSPVREKVATELRDIAAAVLEEHLEMDGQPLSEVVRFAMFLKCPWAREP